MDYKTLYEQSQKELFGLQFDFDEKNKEHTEKELEKENEELKVEAKKIEAAVRSSRGDALELCLPIWYGQDEDEDED
jgi:hypothetical protein